MKSPVAARLEDVHVTSLSGGWPGGEGVMLLGWVPGAQARGPGVLAGLMGAPRKLMEPEGLSQPPVPSEGG